MILSTHRQAPKAPALPVPGFNGPGILTTIAEIPVYGKTLTGSNLTATGRIQVTFADFVD